MPPPGLQSAPQRSPAWPWRRRRSEHSLSSGSIKPSGILWLLSTVLWYSLLCVGVVELVVLTIHSAVGPNDFCQDYASAVSLLHGHTAYPPVFCNSTISKLPGGVEYNSHPPTSIVLFIPFGLLPKNVAMILWGMVSLLAYLVSIWLLLRAVKWPVLPGLALFAFGSIFWLPSIDVTEVLNFEQVLLLLLVGSWLLAERRQERRQETGAGVLLGIACLLKIWPVLFLLVPLLQRRWRLVAVTGGVMAVGILLALVVEGPSAFVAYAGPVRIVEDGWVMIGYAGNISLTGMVVGLLAGYSGSASRQAPPFPGIHAGTALLVGEALSAVLLLGGIGLVWWKRRSLEDETGNLLAFGFLVTLIQVAFPLSWPWAVVTLFLPAATLVLALRRLPPPPRWWWWLLGASLVVLNIEFVNVWAFIRQLHQLEALPTVNPTLGMLLFVAAQAYLLARQPGRHPEASEAPPIGEPAVTVESPARLL